MTWSTQNEGCTLAPNEVHVWRVELDSTIDQRERYVSVLSPDEKARATRYLNPELGLRYSIARGALRCILGGCLGIDPHQVCFAYEANGKPTLANPKGASAALHFNLSHAHTLALCAVALNDRVGVDVEHLGRDIEVDILAQRFFSENEYATLQAVPPSQKRALFFRYWTCKEACIKASGQGLYALEKVEVALNQTNRPRWKGVEGWRLYELAPGDDYTAAVVAEGEHHELYCWQFDDGSTRTKLGSLERR